MSVDLDALGVHAAPLAVLDDFHVSELPFSAQRAVPVMLSQGVKAQ